MPRVAVAIPACNAEGTVAAAVESVLGQTFRDFSLTVVDDGSTDRTADALAPFASRMGLLRIPNGGVSGARNLGVAGVDSEFVAFLDADDSWAPDKLARQVDALDANAEAGACYTGIQRVGANSDLPVIPALDTDDVCRDLLLFSSIVPASPSCSLIRRDLFDALGGWDRRFSQCADWDLLLRLSLHTAFASVDAPLVRYSQAEGRMSANIDLLKHDTFAVLDAFYAADLPARYRNIKRRVYSNHWLIVSGSYLHQRRWPDAVRCLVRGLRTDPANISRPAGAPLRWGRRLRHAQAGIRPTP